MPLIAITGGIGSGKSEFTRELLRATGAQALDTDQCTRDVLENDPDAQREIRAAFGDGAFDAQGQIDRAALRETVFADLARRQKLEAILHPRIRAAWTAWAQARNASGAILLVEIPLLYETDAATLFDYSIVVGCSRETQLRRLAETRNLPRLAAERIIASQQGIETKVQRCDCLIWNNGSLAAFQRQIALCARLLQTLPILTSS